MEPVVRVKSPSVDVIVLCRSNETGFLVKNHQMEPPVRAFSVGITWTGGVNPKTA